MNAPNEEMRRNLRVTTVADLTTTQRETFPHLGCTAAPYITRPHELVFAASCESWQEQVLRNLAYVTRVEPMPTYRPAYEHSAKEIVNPSQDPQSIPDDLGDEEKAGRQKTSEGTAPGDGASMMPGNDVYTITFEDVQKTAEEFGCLALHLPEHQMVIVMDDTITDNGFIKQFEDTPYGLTRARRWAVRLNARDETSDQSFEELRAECLAALKLGHGDWLR